METATKGTALGAVLDANANVINSANSPVYIAQAGCKRVRLDLHLVGAIKSWSDPTLVASYRAVIQSYKSLGVSVLGLLGPGILYQNGGGQTAWNANAQELGGSGTNDFITQYVAAVTPVLTAVGDLVDEWEIWNEPNQYNTASGATRTGGMYLYPSLFAPLLKGAHDAIKAHRATDPVISGGLFQHTIGGVVSPANAAITYLDALYAALWALGYDTHSKPFDRIGLHPYVDQLGPLDEQHLQQYVNWVLQSIVTHEGENRVTGLSMTELGWTTASVSQAVQADNIARAFHVLSDQPEVKEAFLFTDVDKTGASLYFGFANSDWTLKQSYTSLEGA